MLATLRFAECSFKVPDLSFSGDRPLVFKGNQKEPDHLWVDLILRTNINPGPALRKLSQTLLPAHWRPLLLEGRLRPAQGGAETPGGSFLFVWRCNLRKRALSIVRLTHLGARESKIPHEQTPFKGGAES